jgi:uroporphyrinogen-III synthase
VTVLAADADVDDLLEGPLPPLAGFTIAVTAARRRDELGGMLERRGARVVYAPALQIVPLADDTELLEATRWCLRQPVDITVATTGIGFRGWIEASDG